MTYSYEREVGQSAPPHINFVLGACEWYRGLSPDTSEVVLQVSDLPSSVTSITYPDSFTAMALGARFSLAQVPRPYHDQVFRLEQLVDLVTTCGVPSGEADAVYDGYHHRVFEKYVEVQVWSDDPVRHFLSASRRGPAA